MEHFLRGTVLRGKLFLGSPSGRFSRKAKVQFGGHFRPRCQFDWASHGALEGSTRQRLKTEGRLATTQSTYRMKADKRITTNPVITRATPHLGIFVDGKAPCKPDPTGCQNHPPETVKYSSNGGGLAWHRLPSQGGPMRDI